MKCIFQAAATIVVAAVCGLSVSARTIEMFHEGWTFCHEGGTPKAVVLPHDWAIEGPFDPDADGGSGKLPWQGKGVYSRTIVLPDKPHGRVFIEFDGVMSRATVFINGNPCARSNYGYLGFVADATPYLMAGTNDVEVKCDTLLHQSRWYPGAGIYREVRIVHTDDVYLEKDDLRVTTDKVLSEKAEIKVSGTIVSRRLKDTVSRVKATIRDANGCIVAAEETTASVEGYDSSDFVIALSVQNPKLWELKDGAYLYSLEVSIGGEGFADSICCRIGLRDFRFDPNEGFILNGQRVQLYGVDLHSDLGPLGMAFDKDAMRRQFAVMRDMGMNALRTSHNAPAPQLLDLCDEMGIFVWNEAFDKWNETCGRGDIPLEEFVEDNLVRFVKRDRNHPCVFAWSIGNEIPIGKAMPPGQEDWATGSASGTSEERCARFRHAMRKYDDSRPIGIGSCWGKRVVDRGDYAALDITGWNYHRQYMPEHERNPGKPLLYTESASAVSEYGFYAATLPTNRADFAVATHQVDSYDFNSSRWSDIPDWEFYRMEEDRFCGGEFVWTGIDYLGEPYPYSIGRKKPQREASRSSYFGICDLCVFPKDRFFLYRSHWNKDAFTLHIVPHHWNFPGKEGKTMPVFVYTSADEAELFVNGKSQGRRVKARDLKPDEKDYYSILPRYRLMWMDVPYEAGEVKAVAYAKDGSVFGTQILRTAGVADRVVLTPERRYGSLCVVQVTLSDKDGNFIPNDNRRISFEASGCEIAAVGNSDPRGYDSFKAIGSHPLKAGRAAVYLRLQNGAKVVLKAMAEGLSSARVEIK